MTILLPARQDELGTSPRGGHSHSAVFTKQRVHGGVRRFHPYSPGQHRRRDVETIICHRHGPRLPKTDDADIYVQEIAECYSMVLAEKHIEVTADSVFERLHIWCARWAPDFPVNLMRATARQAAAQAGRLSGSELVGQRLRLSHKERSELKIVTIGSYDVDRKTRKRLARDRKRKRDRDRAAQKRALEGRQSREEYLAAHRASRDQPWITLGISRRTYYRRQKKLWLTTGSDFEHVRSVPLIEDALLKDGRPGSQSIMRGSHCERALERSELGGCQ